MKFSCKNIIKEKEKIIEDLNLNKEDIIYISGSLIEGIGNKYSDLDIFIITQNIDRVNLTKYDYDEKKLKTVFREYVGEKCDIEIYDLATVEKNINILNDYDFYDVRVANIFKDIDSIKFLSFLHRLLVGDPINNLQRFKLLREKINEERYYQLLKLFYQNQIENSYDDLVGNMEEKNYMTTILLGNVIVPSLIAYYLASKKVSIDRRKWSYIKLLKLSELDLEAKKMLEKFEEFIMLKMDKKIYAKKLLNFINEIVV